MIPHAYILKAVPNDSALEADFLILEPNPRYGAAPMLTEKYSYLNLFKNFFSSSI